MAEPIPPEAPVMTTTFPARPVSMGAEILHSSAKLPRNGDEAMRKVNVTIITMLLALGAWSVSTANAQAGKKAVFGGSGPNAGWGSIGVITKEAMKFYGWDVRSAARAREPNEGPVW